MELIPGLDRIDMEGLRGRAALDAALGRLSVGEIRVKVRLQNFLDVQGPKKSRRRKGRGFELEAVADTGAVMTLLPQEAVELLGLPITDTVVCALANDEKIELRKASGLWITVAGRSMNTNCLVGPPGCTALIGQVVVEELDLIADPALRTLTVRPESPLRPTLGLRAMPLFSSGRI